MRDILRRMTSLGLVHIGGIERLVTGHKVPQWCLGQGPSWFQTNQPMPANVELIAFASMLRALARPHSVHELADATGLDRFRVCTFLRALHGLRMAYVESYHRCRDADAGGPYVRQYVLGYDKDDTPKPASVPKEQCWAQQRARKKIRVQMNLTPAVKITIAPPMQRHWRTNTYA